MLVFSLFTLHLYLLTLKVSLARHLYLPNIVQKQITKLIDRFNKAFSLSYSFAIQFGVLGIDENSAKKPPPVDQTMENAIHHKNQYSADKSNKLSLAQYSFNVQQIRLLIGWCHSYCSRACKGSPSTKRTVHKLWVWVANMDFGTTLIELKIVPRATSLQVIRFVTSLSSRKSPNRNSLLMNKIHCCL